jgi:tetratricopeptide (TPR) repeat protein
MPAIAFASDFEAALVRARRDRRPVLVQFLLAGRPLCQTMEDKTLAAPEVVALVSARLVAVKVDPERRADLFEALVGGRGALGSAVVDETRDPFAALNGFAEPAAFVAFLERALRGHAAVVAARRACARRPRDPSLRLRLAAAYEAAGGLRRAGEEYGRLVDAVPEGPRTRPEEARALVLSHERLARFKVMRGRNLEARVHLEAVARLDPGDRYGLRPQLLLTEGLTLAVERRAKEARPVLEGLIGSFPGFAERDHALLALGLALHDVREDAAAKAALERLVREHPGSRWRAAALDQIEHIKNPEADHQH